VHQLEIRDVDTQLHCWRAEENLQVAVSEPLFAKLAVFVVDLRGVLQAFHITE
jgi:hypothetical protein